MSQKILVAIANGSEEIEAVTTIDVLRRAAIDVTVAAVAPSEQQQICASRGVNLLADCHISAVAGQSFDMIVLPGGMPGAEHLRDDAILSQLLLQQYRQRWIAAICAAPAVVLGQHRLLNGPCTGHPAFHQHLPGQWLNADKAVVCDRENKVVTSQGPGTALSFALALVEILSGRATREKVAAPMCIGLGD